ncbi:1774_t:CDS:2, partial [Scutellospora calospora]
MAPMNKCCGCISMRSGVITIAILWMSGGIYGLIQNFQLLSDNYQYIIGSTVQIALAVNSLTILISGFGLMVVCCAESARLLQIFSGLFIFVVVIHFIYAIYFAIVVSSSGYWSYYEYYTINHFVGAILGVYFAKVIADYAKIVRLEQNNTQTLGIIEASNIANNQVRASNMTNNQIITASNMTNNQVIASNIANSQVMASNTTNHQ